MEEQIDHQYEEFKKEMMRMIGLDLSSYKEKQMKRRIDQMIQRYKLKTYKEFAELLRRDAKTLDRFRDYLTINTSQFFRDTHIYKKIEGEILPTLIKNTSSLAVWSAGCSIGAEPYSLAIILNEINSSGRYKIDATDFDRVILGKAQEGLYKSNLLVNASKERIDKYFDKDGVQYRVKDFLKKNINFKEHNLLKDSFPGKYDLILCRNVFIYFKNDIQRQLVKQFAASLKTGGYFIIGCSELISNIEDFGLEKQVPAIYKKIT